jgi:hypothetical protein
VGRRIDYEVAESWENTAADRGLAYRMYGWPYCNLRRPGADRWYDRHPWLLIVPVVVVLAALQLAVLWAHLVRGW